MAGYIEEGIHPEDFDDFDDEETPRVDTDSVARMLGVPRRVVEYLTDDIDRLVRELFLPGDAPETESLNLFSIFLGIRIHQFWARKEQKPNEFHERIERAASILDFPPNHLSDMLDYIGIDRGDEPNTVSDADLEAIIAFLNSEMLSIEENFDEVRNGKYLEIERVASILQSTPADIAILVDRLGLDENKLTDNDIYEISGTVLSSRNLSVISSSRVSGLEDVRGISAKAVDANASVPLELSGAAAPGRRKVEADSVGVTYEKLFFPWLLGARDLTLTDPWMVTRHQLQNLTEFLETLYLHRRDDLSIHVTLQTAKRVPDPKKGEVWPEPNLKEIKRIFVPYGIELSIAFLPQRDLHDRGIETSDTLWGIDLGRGLDIYQPHGRSKFDPRNHVQALRRVRPFTMSYHRL